MAAIYDIQRLRALAAPSFVAAIPNLSEAAAGYAARRADTQQQEAKTAQTKERQDAALELTADKLAADLAEHKRYMDIWEEQNKWATGLGILNLGVQGLASWDQAKRLEKQDLALQKIAEAYGKQAELQEESNTLLKRQTLRGVPYNAPPWLYDKRTEYPPTSM